LAARQTVPSQQMRNEMRVVGTSTQQTGPVGDLARDSLKDCADAFRRAPAWFDTSVDVSPRLRL